MTTPTIAAEGATDSDQSRYQRGMNVLAAVDGDAGQRVIESLSDIAPALAAHIVSYGFGDVYARPGLTPAQRQLVTLGMLTALGGCEPQLEVHTNAALNVGLTPTEIVEAVIHAAVYCGFPKALNAIGVVKKVFTDRKIQPTADDTPHAHGDRIDDPTVLDPEHHQTIFANDIVRVRRISYGPDDRSVMHDYDDCVVVWLTDGKLRFEMPDGSAVDVEGRAHDVNWVPAGRHRPINTTGDAFAAVAIDLRHADHTRSRDKD